MLFSIGGFNVNCEPQGLAKEVSRHTGRPLRRLIIRFTASDKAQVPAVNTVTSMATEKNPETKWDVTQTSYSYPQGGHIHTHTWHLREHEELAVAALHIGDLVTHPHAYHETFSGEELTIHARVRLTADEHDRWSAIVLSEDTPMVRREGISDEPRSMKLIAHAWSEADGQFTWYFTLSDALNGESSPSLEWTGIRSRHQAVGALVTGYGRLLELLKKKGVITEAEIAELFEDEPNNSSHRSIQLLRVNADIDARLGDATGSE